MSVLIKNMEMPNSCSECRMDDSEFGFCHAMGDFNTDVYQFIVNKTKPDWCPLVEIPPHGDLIDRDALIERIQIGRAHV